MSRATSGSINERRTTNIVEPNSSTNSAVGDELRANMRAAAEAMVLQAPIMSVAATTFDATPGASVGDDVAADPRPTSSGQPPGASATSSSTTTSSSKELYTMEQAILLKRAAMWRCMQVIAANHKVVMHHYRYKRLRWKLEVYLLPILLRRRTRSFFQGPSTTSTTPPQPELVDTGNGRARNGSQVSQISDQPVTGPQLLGACSWMAALEDVAFAEAVAKSMQKLTKLAGDPVVTADENSQSVLYLATSGKFEWVTPPSSSEMSYGSANSGTPRGMSGQSWAYGSCSALTPSHNRNDPAAAAPRGERVDAPLAFGDVFGGPSRYSRSLMARVKCTVWYIPKATFDTLLAECKRPQTRERFITLMKEEMVSSMRANFPLIVSKLPLLRKMPNHLVEACFDKFVPVVLQSGTTLFEEGTNASSVYVICDGSVCRKRKPSPEDPTGATQTLTVAAGWSKPGRYIMVGEEPHVLPEKYRHSCSVASEYAKGYRIPGTLFANMLLDDPRQLLKLREEALLQRSSMMRLKLEALRQVPMLADFPQPRLQTIHAALTPRVVGRSTMLCQSQQPLKEILLVVRGDIRDPRRPSVPPPLLPPPPKATSSSGKSVTLPDLDPSPQASPFERGQSIFGGQRGSIVQRSVTSGGVARALSVAGLLQSFRHSIATTSLSPGVDQGAVNNEDDTNPMLPSAHADRILYALGGSWEGLLSEKWTSSWETVGLVEVWVLPTVVIRNEYNELHRSMQASLLQQMRMAQMKDMGLDEMPNTKLLPMSAYRTTGSGIFDASSRMASADRRDTKLQSRGMKLVAKSNTHSVKAGGMSLDASVTLDSRGLLMNTASSGDAEGSVSASKPKLTAIPPQPKPQPPTATSNAAADDSRPVEPHAPSHATKHGPRRKAGRDRKHRRSPPPVKGQTNASAVDMSMLTESEKLEEMRRQAQGRNEEHAALRLLPMEEAIRMRKEKLRHGHVARSAMEQLPPLTSREDMLYFRFDELAPPPIGSSTANSARGGFGKSPTSGGLMPPDAPRAKSPTAEKLQRLYTTAVPFDEDVLGSDTVVHDVESEGYAEAKVRERDVEVRPTTSWHPAPLPPPLQQALEATSYQLVLRAVTSSSSPRRGVVGGLQRVPQPPATRPQALNFSSTMSSSGTTKPSAAADHRWFHHIPERAPTPSYRVGPATARSAASVVSPSSDRSLQAESAPAFDVLLLQTLRGAERAGLVRL